MSIKTKRIIALIGLALTVFTVAIDAYMKKVHI